MFYNKWRIFPWPDQEAAWQLGNLKRNGAGYSLISIYMHSIYHHCLHKKGLWISARLSIRGDAPGLLTFFLKCKIAPYTLSWGAKLHLTLKVEVQLIHISIYRHCLEINIFRLWITARFSIGGGDARGIFHFSWGAKLHLTFKVEVQFIHRCDLRI